MQKAASTDSRVLVKYFVVGAKGDDPKHPNAFFIEPMAPLPTLADIKRSWPLAGDFHFSFKTRNKRYAIAADLLLLLSSCEIILCIWFVPQGAHVG